MKKVLLITGFFVAALSGFAQTKKEQAVIERTYLLSQTVFGTKDSATIEDLFAKKATYGHSSGKIETREEAIRGIVQNKSTYSDTTVSDMKVVLNDDVAIVRYLFKAKESKADGTASPLNFSVMVVWVKEKGKWRLIGRQTVRLS